MTNAELIAKIKAEIARRVDILATVSVKQEKDGDSEMSTYYHGKAVSLGELLSFISSLESEKPNQEGLEEEIERVVTEYSEKIRDGKVMKPSGVERIARHFAQWQKEQMMKEYVRKDSLWKPTPEQLEAMECAIIDFEEDGCNTIARYLKEIYNQIKKL